jgi:hypothetical protein
MANRAPRVAAERSRKILLHTLGSSSVEQALVTVLFLTVLNWFGNSLYEMLQWLDGQRPSGWLHVGLAVTSFLILCLWLMYRARKVKEGWRLQVVEDDQPRRVRGLILFLSALSAEECERLRARSREGFDLAAFRESFGRLNWRMPVEAVAYHARQLNHVIVIPSASASGSAGQMALFRELLADLFPEARFECLGIDQIPGDHPAGLDFERTPELLARATDDAYEFLREKGLKPMDILIDITSGTKTVTVVGCGVALAEGRRMQYVNKGYDIRVYDVSYSEA